MSLVSKGSQLDVGQMAPGEMLVSSNGLFQFIVQDDGNIVLYHSPSTLGNDGVAYWDTGTGTGHGGVSQTLLLQDDGNLVLYRGAHAIWATGTAQGGAGSCKNCMLIMQDDGNLVLYKDANRAVLWASHTASTVRLDKFGDVVWGATPTYLPAKNLGAFRKVLQNGSNRAAKLTATGGIQYSDTSSITISKGLEISGSVEFEAGLPWVGKSKVTIGVKASYNYTTGKSRTQTMQGSIGATADVAANSQMDTWIHVSQEQFELPFDGTAFYTITRGGSQTTAVLTGGGTYKGGQGYTTTIQLGQTKPYP